MNTESSDFLLTEEEYAAWDIYAKKHENLLGQGGLYRLLAMFLSHFRRGINLNLPKGTDDRT